MKQSVNILRLGKITFSHFIDKNINGSAFVVANEQFINIIPRRQGCFVSLYYSITVFIFYFLNHWKKLESSRDSSGIRLVLMLMFSKLMEQWFIDIWKLYFVAKAFRQCQRRIKIVQGQNDFGFWSWLFKPKNSVNCVHMASH